MYVVVEAFVIPRNFAISCSDNSWYSFNKTKIINRLSDSWNAYKRLAHSKSIVLATDKSVKHVLIFSKSTTCFFIKYYKMINIAFLIA